MGVTAAKDDIDRRSLTERIRWLLFFRVLIATVLLAATAVAHVGLESETDFPLGAAATLIVIAYLFAMGSAAVLPQVRNLRAFALFQVCGDVLLVSAAVMLTGALQSPMAVWYNLAIIGAAMLLGRRSAYTAAVFSAVTYGVLMNLVYWGALPSAILFAASPPGPGLGLVYQMAANIASFFSIAFLSSMLAERATISEQALEISEAHLKRIESVQQALIQNLESGVLTTDAEGVVESTNRAVEAILGLPGADLVGRRIGELFPVLRPPLDLSRVLAPGALPTELRHPGGDGKERTLRCTSAPITDTYRNPIGMLLILQDVTELERLEGKGAEADAQSPPAPPATDVAPIAGLVGQSRAMNAIGQIIRKVAPTDSTVLLTGESGTGKELAARAIHSLSARRDKPMIVVNCGAIPENLIESELFGHVRGAYTGAVADRRGLFRAADGGTIFLDEIGDLPLLLQVKLLRVLQERSFTPVGGQTQVAVDVRIIAATNRDLEADVAAGRFREDLFYRLNVIQIEMPPLRDRREDLPALIAHFVTQFSQALRKPRCTLSPGAMKRLLSYPYPGNIRELENVIQHSLALAGSELVTEQDLPERLAVAAGMPAGPDVADAGSAAPADLDWMRAKGSNLDSELEELERRFLGEALKRSGGVRKRAAEILGINYRSLRHRLSKYGFGNGEGKEPEATEP